MEEDDFNAIDFVLNSPTSSEPPKLQAPATTSRIQLPGASPESSAPSLSLPNKRAGGIALPGSHGAPATTPALPGSSLPISVPTFFSYQTSPAPAPQPLPSVADLAPRFILAQSDATDGRPILKLTEFENEAAKASAPGSKTSPKASQKESETSAPPPPLSITCDGAQITPFLRTSQKQTPTAADEGPLFFSEDTSSKHTINPPPDPLANFIPKHEKIRRELSKKKEQDVLISKISTFENEKRAERKLMDLGLARFMEKQGEDPSRLFDVCDWEKRVIFDTNDIYEDEFEDEAASPPEGGAHAAGPSKPQPIVNITTLKPIDFVEEIIGQNDKHWGSRMEIPTNEIESAAEVLRDRRMRALQKAMGDAGSVNPQTPAAVAKAKAMAANKLLDELLEYHYPRPAPTIARTTTSQSEQCSSPAGDDGENESEDPEKGQLEDLLKRLMKIGEEEGDGGEGDWLNHVIWSDEDLDICGPILRKLHIDPTDRHNVLFYQEATEPLPPKPLVPVGPAGNVRMAGEGPPKLGPDGKPLRRRPRPGPEDADARTAPDLQLDRFNISNDQFYESVVRNKTKSTASKPFIQHSIPALKLTEQWFKTTFMEEELLFSHRPRVYFSPRYPMRIAHLPTLRTREAEARLAAFTNGDKAPEPFLMPESGKHEKHKKQIKKIGPISSYTRQRERERDSGSMLGAVTSSVVGGSSANVVASQAVIGRDGPAKVPEKKGQLSALDGRVILFEYLQESPPVLSNVGMGARLTNYYKRKADSHAEVPQAEDGVTTVVGSEHQLPQNLLCQLTPGRLTPCLETGMYRCLAAQHQPQYTDFLLLKRNDGIFIREIPALFAAGHEQPITEVQPPSSRWCLAFLQQRLFVFICRLLKKKTEDGKRGDFGRLKASEVQSKFPNIPDTAIRKALKACARFERSMGAEGSHWVVRDDFIFPSEEELREKITPEMCCLYQSSMAGQHRLNEAGVTPHATLAAYVTAIQGAASMDFLRDAVRYVETERNNTPWNMTGNFLDVLAGKDYCQQGLLDLAKINLSRSEAEELQRLSREKARDKKEIDSVTIPDFIPTPSPQEAQEILEKSGRMKPQQLKRDSRPVKIRKARLLLYEQYLERNQGSTRSLLSSSLGKDNQRTRDLLRKMFAVEQDKLSQKKPYYPVEEENLRSLEEEAYEFDDYDEFLLQSIQQNLGGAAPASTGGPEKTKEGPSAQAKAALLNAVAARKDSAKAKANQRVTDDIDEQEALKEILKALGGEASDEGEGPSVPGTGPSGKRMVVKKTFYRTLPDGTKVFDRVDWVEDPIQVDLIMRKQRHMEKHPEASKKVFMSGDAEPMFHNRERRKMHETYRRLLMAKENKRPFRHNKPMPKAQMRGMVCSACGAVGHMSTNQLCPLFGTGAHNKSLKKNEAVKSQGTTLKIKTTDVVKDSVQKTRDEKAKARAEREAKRLKNLKGKRKDFSSTESKAKRLKRDDPVVRLKEILAAILDTLKRDESGSIFLSPVDTSRYTDYLTVIPQPMDLSTIEKRLLRFDYTNVAAFYADVKLMTDNCLTYCRTRYPGSIPTAEQQMRVFLLTVKKHAREIMHVTNCGPDLGLPPGVLETATEVKPKPAVTVPSSRRRSPSRAAASPVARPAVAKPTAPAEPELADEISPEYIIPDIGSPLSPALSASQSPTAPLLPAMEPSAAPPAQVSDNEEEEVVFVDEEDEEEVVEDEEDELLAQERLMAEGSEEEMIVEDEEEDADQILHQADRFPLEQDDEGEEMVSDGDDYDSQPPIAAGGYSAALGGMYPPAPQQYTAPSAATFYDPRFPAPPPIGEEVFVPAVQGDVDNGADMNGGAEEEFLEVDIDETEFS